MIVRAVLIVVVVWQVNIQLPIYTHMQSVHIITNVASSNPAHGEVYSMKHYVIKLVSYMRQVVGFIRSL